MRVIKNPLTLVLLFVVGLGAIDRLGGQEKSPPKSKDRPSAPGKATTKTTAAVGAKGDAAVASGASEKPEKKDTQNPKSIATVEAPKVKMSYPKPQGIGPHDWGQWGGSTIRNNTPDAKNIPTEWEVLPFDNKAGKFPLDKMQNVKWAARLGSQSYGNPVVANGHAYVGTNNGMGYLKRYPNNIDLGVLLCLDEKTGKFLWQHSSEKLITGRVHDWPLMGMCAAPLVENDRVWIVTSRGEVLCLDTEGFYDGDDDGPVQKEQAWLFDVVKNEDPKLDKQAAAIKDLNAGKLPAEMRKEFERVGMPLPEKIALKTVKEGTRWTIQGQVNKVKRDITLQLQGPRLRAFRTTTPDDKDEADVVWRLDMMADPLSISQHNMCACSLTSAGDMLFICTGNGVDDAHINIPAPSAPSFIAVDKTSGKVLWTDNSPGRNILHGQWSSPAYAVLDGVAQVIFGGGDGWLYSFAAKPNEQGKAELLWKFDCNPKESKYVLGGRADRNHIIGTPVVYDGMVYIGVGEDPEHAEGIGHFWCITPTKRGDVSSELAFSLKDPKTPLPPRRNQAVIRENGEIARPNPNSAAIWHYAYHDQDGNGKIDFEETMHRTCGTACIQDDLVFVADFSGLVHCIDAKNGTPYWTHDMLAASWGSPLIVEGKMYVGDEDGDISIFKVSKEKELIGEVSMGSSVYSTPIVANGVLYISNKDTLYAIQAEDEK